MEMIEKICREHTDLAESDIRHIEEVAETLEAVADLMTADVFIDCRTRDKDVAVVVAQARPSNGKTLYKRSVVAEFAYRSNEPAALRTLDIGMPTMDMMAKTQENRDVRQNVSPIKNKRGRVIACLIAETDITADLKTKRHLSMLSRTTEQLTEALISMLNKEKGIPYHVTDGIAIFNREGICVYTNPVARGIYKKLGYMNEPEGLVFSNLALEDIDLETIFEKKQVNSSGVNLGGLVLNIKYTIMQSKENARPTGAVMLISDETAVMAKEKELILKSVAIKEIHHRVKNNLQTIASLLRLQSRRVDNESAKRAFSKSISRVLSIAATHEILAQNGVDDVDLTVMINRILNSVAGHSLSASRGIKIDITGDAIHTDSDVATSIALVVNELIQNCIKYAFVGRDHGTITVEIRKGTAYSNICITDDGIGFDEDKVDTSISLGTSIVRQLVEGKLGGTLQVESGAGGTKVLFDFVTGNAPSEEETNRP
ncbi:MAG: sensor histidine kinase [Desulfobacter sp.]|nr:MAG: sensor histidine kinase [Desulfobacter sp.]